MHLGIFEQPMKIDFFNSLLILYCGLLNANFGMKSFQLSALNFEFQILNFELLNFIIFKEGGIWGDR